MVNQARAERQTSTTSVEEARSAALAAAQAGLDKKAEDVRILDIRGLASYADFLVVMTAASDRQVSAIADAVDEELRKRGHRPIGVEGQGAGNWILIDTGDIVVHVFHADSRSFYDLDGLWSDAKRVALPAPRPAVSAV